MNYKFRNLVFEGGGVKGIAYGGALLEMQAAGHLDHVIRVAGTSAGAITATGLAIGLSPEGVGNLVAETDFSKFADDSFGVTRDTARLINNFGWHKGNAFKSWISKLIRKHTGSSTTTFAELQQHAQTDSAFKELYVVGCNLTAQDNIVYSAETTPDVPIRDAVRISMSIPLYFQCVRNEGGDVLVDGGITRNYPIDLFDHERYLTDPENGERVSYNMTPGFRFNHETLGFRLDERGEKIASLINGSLTPHNIENIVDFGQALITFMRSMASRVHLHSNDWNRTVAIDTTGVSATEFQLPVSKINKLTENGKLGVQTHFEWRTQNLNKPN